MGFIFFIIGGFLIADLFSKNGHQEQMHDMARMQQMHDMEMTQQMQDMQQQEIIRQMNDPYMTPGLDAGIDEACHGIDHGMGIANPEHNFEGMNDSFFGNCSDDSFFGSSDSSFFGGGSDDSFFGGGSDDSFFGGGCGGGDFF